MKISKLAWILIILASASSLAAQASGPNAAERLTDAEVRAAINKGINEKPGSVGVSMQQHHFMGPFFSITVYRPGGLIEYQAAEAHRLLKPFTIDDVTEAMRARVIAVQANPSIPTESQYRSEAESVSHVVIQDSKKSTIIQPILEETFTNSYAASIGNPFELSGKHDIFPYQAVMDLCIKQDGCKIIVTIIGESRRKDFEISAKDLQGP